MSAVDNTSILPNTSDFSTAVGETSRVSHSDSINGFNNKSIRIAHAAMWGGQKDGFFEVVQRLNGKIISRAVFHVCDIEDLIVYMKRNHQGGIWYWTCYLNRTEHFRTPDGKPVPPFFVKHSGERVTPGLSNLLGFAGVTLSIGEYSQVKDNIPYGCLEWGWRFVYRLQRGDLKPASLVCSPSTIYRDKSIEGPDRGLSCTLVFDGLLTDPFTWYYAVKKINEIHDCHQTNLNWPLYTPIGGTPDVNLHPVPGSVFSLHEAHQVIYDAVRLTDPGFDWRLKNE